MPTYNPAVLAESSPSPAVTFRNAALRLAQAEPNDDAWSAAARDAASALVDLARTDHDGEALREFLGPIPAAHWTVLCYEPGGVSPADTYDFDAPADAVLVCADCGDADHVHAELVVTDGQGLRWTALIRHRDDVEFEPPDLQTVQNESDDPGSQAAVLALWHSHLTTWGRQRAARPPEVDRARIAQRPTLGQRIESRLEELQQQNDELRAEVESLREDVRDILRLVTEQHNASVASVARALRDRLVK